MLRRALFASPFLLSLNAFAVSSITITAEKIEYDKAGVAEMIMHNTHAEYDLKKDNIVFEALIEGVAPSGKLIIQHAFQEEINFGDIEWVIK